MSRLQHTAVCVALAAASFIASAASTTYTYQGPSFYGSSDHLAISFTTSAPLAPSKSYLSQGNALVTGSSVQVITTTGAKPNFTLPVTTFQVHTNSSGLIDAWYIFGGFSTLAGTSPHMTGTDRQAYSVNTLVFIPGSDIPGATGLVTGPYAYDQATETQFYASCTGAPPGCNVAGNGQPYVSVYSAIISPSGTSGSSWAVSAGPVDPPPPPPAPVSIGGNLPAAQVGLGYVASLTASGGTPPYVWSASGLPTGLGLRDGTVSGTPTVAGTSNVAVTATDSTGASASASYVLQVYPGSCNASNATITYVGRDFLKVNGGLELADHVWYTPKASDTVFTGGTTTFVLGELVDYVGTLDSASGCHATSMTVKPPAATDCVAPNGAKRSHAKAVITAVGVNFVQAGARRIDYAACTSIRFRKGRTAPAVGDSVEWTGYVENNGNIMAARLNFR